MKKIIAFLFIFTALDAFALDDWDFAVAEILPGSGDLEKPSWTEKIVTRGKNAERDLIVAYEENNFDPYVYCLDIVDATGTNFKEGVFHVESLVGQLKKEVEDIDWNPFDRWNWMAHYTMGYTITCGNGITYRGVFKWRTFLWSCVTNMDHGGCSDESDHDVKTSHVLDVGSYNYTTNSFASFSEANGDGNNVAPIENLVVAWNGRKVEYPEWTYQGDPGKKLARPVIFVHGLNSSYDTWGVEPLTDVSGEAKKAEASFQKVLSKGSCKEISKWLCP